MPSKRSLFSRTGRASRPARGPDWPLNGVGSWPHSFSRRPVRKLPLRSRRTWSAVQEQRLRRALTHLALTSGNVLVGGPPDTYWTRVGRTVQGTVRRTCRPAREAPHPADACGGPFGEFFAALGPDWRLTAAERARLASAVTMALDAGWAPVALADFTARTPAGRETRSRCWRRGCHPPSCPCHLPGGHPGRRGAVSVAWRPGCSASMATRRACARAASRPV
jgi:hypothetical protein